MCARGAAPPEQPPGAGPDLVGIKTGIAGGVKLGREVGAEYRQRPPTSDPRAIRGFRMECPGTFL
jgi:hypothetical protein